MDTTQSKLAVITSAPAGYMTWPWVLRQDGTMLAMKSECRNHCH